MNVNLNLSSEAIPPKKQKENCSRHTTQIHQADILYVSQFLDKQANLNNYHQINGKDSRVPAHFMISV